MLKVHFHVPVKDHENWIPIHKEVCITLLLKKLGLVGQYDCWGMLKFEKGEFTASLLWSPNIGFLFEGMKLGFRKHVHVDPRLF